MSFILVYAICFFFYMIFEVIFTTDPFLGFASCQLGVLFPFCVGPMVKLYVHRRAAVFRPGVVYTGFFISLCINVLFVLLPSSAYCEPVHDTCYSSLQSSRGVLGYQSKDDGRLAIFSNCVFVLYIWSFSFVKKRLSNEDRKSLFLVANNVSIVAAILTVDTVLGAVMLHSTLDPDNNMPNLYYGLSAVVLLLSIHIFGLVARGLNFWIDSLESRHFESSSTEYLDGTGKAIILFVLTCCLLVVAGLGVSALADYLHSRPMELLNSSAFDIVTGVLLMLAMITSCVGLMQSTGIGMWIPTKQLMPIFSLSFNDERVKMCSPAVTYGILGTSLIAIWGGLCCGLDDGHGNYSMFGKNQRVVGMIVMNAAFFFSVVISSLFT